MVTKETRPWLADNTIQTMYYRLVFLKPIILLTNVTPINSIKIYIVNK